MSLDVLFINPDSSSQVYQGLADTYSAIEPPTWSLLLAESCRTKDYEVAILDCDAERLSLDRAVSRVEDLSPRLVLFVVYGQNPNSGTTNMVGALALAQALKDSGVKAPIAFVGSHTSALPRQVLSEKCVDIVLLNEGVYALHSLLSSDLNSHLPQINGIGYKVCDGANNESLILNPPERVVPQNRMDIDLPGYAWDLLPFDKKPLDLYRAHFWHVNFDHASRSPFAAIYTSLGCNFGCDFCMINILNRADNSDGIHAANSSGMRFWSPEWVRREMKKIADLGVTALRISDEMFFLNRKFYEPILKNVVDDEFGFNMWAYSRIDTVREDQLELFKKAGVSWLALGLEAGNQIVREEVSKGTFKDVNIRSVCSGIRGYDINIIGNYIFGFPEDNLETMQQTLDLAVELNTEMANMYPCQALPGSPMYYIALKNGWALPESYSGFGFLSYDCTPLPTKYLSAEEVLRFRDHAWTKYFTNPEYLSLVESKFGFENRRNVESMASIKLRRRVLGD